MKVLRTTRLRELEERASFSQMELSELSGVSRATIADLELGKRGARPRTRRKLAKALGVEPWELVGDVKGDSRGE
jgi:transcriptional regulator with XRE-family HTH domain